MKILIVGSGGREHAIGSKLLENSQSRELYFAPGNAGTAQIGKNIPLNNSNALADFCVEKAVDLTIVGSEALLVEGIVDVFQSRGIAILGPDKQAAQLEGSKVFAKRFMEKYKVRTAPYAFFSSYEKAVNYLDGVNYPIVIKASGLAFGKGVVIAQDKASSLKALELMMKEKIFGDAVADEVLIEEYLQGYEASVLSVFNGKEIVPFLSAKDYKKIGKGETGLNTGGMGAIAPNPHMSEAVWQDFNENILKPTLDGLYAEKLFFSGVVFFGLMITQKGVYLLEYNLRMGDPETQSLLPLMESDFLEVIQKTINKEAVKIAWKSLHSCVVVMASGGYPESYEKGHEVFGLDALPSFCYIAGAEKENNRWITSSGRVLNVLGMGASAEQARRDAYEKVKKISFKESYYRDDIGRF